MWNLLADAENTVRATLKEATTDLPTFTNYLVRIHNTAGDYACIVSLDVNTSRYSEFILDLSQDDEENGAVHITEVGEYSYTIYGQTSATNLDYTDSSVKGVVEKGTAVIRSGDTFYNDISSSLTADVQL